LTITTLAQAAVNGLSLAGIYILVALGLTIIMSILGIVQMAHGEIYMLGSYVVFFLITVLGLGFFPALILSTILIGGFGVLLERYCFKPFRGQLERSLILSIGLMLILQNLVLSIAGGTPKSLSSPFSGVLHFAAISISWERMFIVLAGIILVSILYLFIRFSKMGQAMLAISENQTAASLQGINLNRVSSIAMFLGCGLAAVAGGLVGALFSLSPTMGSFALTQGLVVIVLGGLGSISGAVIGGLLIGMIDGVMPTFTTANVAGLIDFGAVVLILLFRPQGLRGHE
jgi:branched-chain amino acid transport system permease protein